MIRIKKPSEGFWGFLGEEAKIRLPRGFGLKKRKRKGKRSKNRKKRYGVLKQKREYINI